MKLHPRTRITQRASNEFESLFIDWMERNQLTYLEVLRILNAATGDCVIKYALRDERHGDNPDEKRADEE